MLLRDAGRRGEAERAWRTTRTLREALVASRPGAPDLRLSLSTVIENLGRLLKGDRRFREAEETWRRVLEIRRAGA